MVFVVDAAISFLIWVVDRDIRCRRILSRFQNDVGLAPSPLVLIDAPKQVVHLVISLFFSVDLWLVLAVDLGLSLERGVCLFILTLLPLLLGAPRTRLDLFGQCINFHRSGKFQPLLIRSEALFTHDDQD